MLNEGSSEISGGVCEQLFGVGNQRAFEHYSDLQRLCGDSDQSVLTELKPVKGQLNVLDGQDTPPLMAIGSLSTAAHTLYFGYQSEDKPRPIVVKSPLFTAGERHLERFKRERALLSELRGNPLWVQTLPEYDRLDTGMVMESLLPGFPLKYLMAIHPELIDANPDLVAMILKQIAQGLQPLHDRGIVHRDVKLDNVLLLAPDSEGNVIKLIDPGIAKFPDMPRLTSPGTFIGTVGYVAPEHVAFDRCDNRADIYALGAIGYNLLARRMVYEKIDHVGDPLDTASLGGHPKPLVDIILRMLSSSPECRPPNIAEVIAELDGMMGSLNGAEKYRSSVMLRSSHVSVGSVTEPLPAISLAVAEDVANSLSNMARNLDVDRGGVPGVGELVRRFRRFVARVTGKK